MRLNPLISFFIFFLLCSFALPAKAQTEAVKVSGKTLAVINTGDFVYPKISPDGSQIAYSRVIVQKGMELTEIAVKNLKTNQTIVLLTPQASKKYATYQAYVSELEWLDANKLTAYVSDGDVDYTKLTFNVRTRRIIKTEYSGDESIIDDSALIPTDLKSAVQTIQTISPELPQKVVNTALQTGNGAFAVENRGVVLQHRYAGYEDDILFFDFQNKTEKILLEVPTTSRMSPSLLGGFGFGENIIFFLSDGGVRIFEHQANETKLLTDYKPGNPGNDSAEFEIKYQTPEKVIFLIRPSSNTSEMRSSLWLYDAQGLKKASDVDNLLDVDIKANRIAFCYWVGKEKRHIIVKELSL